MGAHHHPLRPAPFEAPVVRIDGEEIPAAEIAAEMQHHPADDPHAAWHAAAEALILGRLLRNEARRLGVAAEPGGDESAEEAQIRALLARELRVPDADEATCRRWYDANRARFRTEPAWRAAHILFAADPGVPAARAAARDQAADALAAVLAAPHRLADLAMRHSACPSKEQGGELGLVEAGTTVPEFEAALRATAPGAVHEAVVETRFGFHVIRVLSREEPEEIGFAEAHPRIAAHLHGSAWRRAAHQYMALLAARAEIEGIVLSASADGPLVQ